MMYNAENVVSHSALTPVTKKPLTPRSIRGLKEVSHSQLNERASPTLPWTSSPKVDDRDLQLLGVLERHQQLVAALNAEVSELRAAKRDEEAGMAALRFENALLQDEVIVCTDNHAVVTRALLLQKTEARELHRAYTEKQSCLRDLQTLLDIRKSKLSDLENRLFDMSDECDKKDVIIGELTFTVASLQSQIRHAENQHSQAAESLAQHRQLNAVLSDDLTAALERIEQLTKSLVAHEPQLHYAHVPVTPERTSRDYERSSPHETDGEACPALSPNTKLCAVVHDLNTRHETLLRERDDVAEALTAARERNQFLEIELNTLHLQFLSFRNTCQMHTSEWETKAAHYHSDADRFAQQARAAQSALDEKVALAEKNMQLTTELADISAQLAAATAAEQVAKLLAQQRELARATAAADLDQERKAQAAALAARQVDDYAPRYAQLVVDHACLRDAFCLLSKGVARLQDLDHSLLQDANGLVAMSECSQAENAVLVANLCATISTLEQALAESAGHHVHLEKVLQQTSMAAQATHETSVKQERLVRELQGQCTDAAAVALALGEELDTQREMTMRAEESATATMEEIATGWRTRVQALQEDHARAIQQLQGELAVATSELARLDELSAFTDQENAVREGLLEELEASQRENDEMLSQAKLSVLALQEENKRLQEELETVSHDAAAAAAETEVRAVAGVTVTLKAQQSQAMQRELQLEIAQQKLREKCAEFDVVVSEVASLRQYVTTTETRTSVKVERLKASLIASENEVNRLSDELEKLGYFS